ncbi:MAG: NUDIX domain-containing protein [Solobacterium sp.]|nr:NUDIX domain-containing protein [Solobacterium sp.]
MKPVEIIGTNYYGKWKYTRTACRGIIIQNNNILLVHGTNADLWMIPGGGMEQDETEEECCKREVAEETGFLIQVFTPLLTIEEYYEDWRYITHYFQGTILNQCDKNLTETEKQAGMETEWLPIEEAIALFSKHAAYTATDEMKRGLYLREFTA